MLANRTLRTFALTAALLGSPLRLPYAGAQVPDWSAELDRVVSEVIELHPDPFSRVSEERFLARVDSLRSGMSRLAPYEIVAGLMELVALIGDGHTRYDSENGSHGFDQRLPFVLYRFTDGYHVVAATRAHANMVGRRVIRMGSIPIDETVRRAKPTISADNDSGLERGIPYAMQRMGLLRGVGVAESNEGLAGDLRDGVG